VAPGRLADLRSWLREAGLSALLVWPDADSGLEPVARRLAEADLAPAGLRRLADPLAPRPTPDRLAPLPAGTQTAVMLAKLAHLLPTLIVAPLPPAGLGGAGSGEILEVEAAQIAALRAAGARLVRVGEAPLPLATTGNARLVAFRNPESGSEHLALVIGAPDATPAEALAPLVRLHSECFTGDVLGSLRCDCGPQLRDALARMAAEGTGVLLYLAQEGRGIGLVNKLRAYALQDRGLDTLDANAALGWGPDERDFAIAAAMLRDLGVGRVRLMTNNPGKLAALAAGGIAVERASLLVAANGVNDRYLSTKMTRFGHLLG
jgi:GTP cyclohydrolase II